MLRPIRLALCRYAMATTKKTVKVPATSRTEEVTSCDDCGSTDLGQYRYKNCTRCGKDLCASCSVEEPEDGGFDYPRQYCKDCWALGEEHRRRKQELEVLIDQSFMDWHHKCQEAWAERQKGTSK